MSVLFRCISCETFLCVCTMALHKIRHFTAAKPTWANHSGAHTNVSCDNVIIHKFTQCFLLVCPQGGMGVSPTASGKTPSTQMVSAAHVTIVPVPWWLCPISSCKQRPDFEHSPLHGSCNLYQHVVIAIFLLRWCCRWCRIRSQCRWWC